MAVGIQLRDLVRGVRAETGKSLSVALGVAEYDAIVYQIQLKQEALYYEYDWPALLTRYTVPLVAGTQFYPYPLTIAFDFINEVWVSELVTATGGLKPVGYGIGPNEYNQTANLTTGWPVEKWQISPVGAPVGGQIEVWPTPSQAGGLMFYGRRALTPLVSDSDVSTLDGPLIVLHVAADILARQKAEDASLKLSQANKLLRNIVRRQGANKQTPFILGGGTSSAYARSPRPGIDYIPS